jgi:hypothetical protein
MNQLTKEEILFFKDNKGTYNAWRTVKGRIYKDNALISPLVKAYERIENTTLSNTCAECVYDVIIWANKLIKEQVGEDKKVEEDKPNKKK